MDYTGEFAIRLGNFGPYLVLDNQIRSRPKETRPPLRLTWGDQSVVGNIFTVANPVRPARRGDQVVSRFLEFGTKVVKPEEIDDTPPVLPSTPRLVRRPVFEVAPSADTATIQAALDRAAAKKGERPVVHLAKGTYKITKTLAVPAGCDVRLVGDAGAETGTVLQWAGPAGRAMLRLAGPAQATVRDLMIAAGAGTGSVPEQIKAGLQKPMMAQARSAHTCTARTLSSPSRIAWLMSTSNGTRQASRVGLLAYGRLRAIRSPSNRPLT